MLFFINDIMNALSTQNRYHVDAVIVTTTLFDDLLVVYSWEKAVE